MFLADFSRRAGERGGGQFRDIAPRAFGKFDRAFVWMFRITAGET